MANKRGRPKKLAVKAETLPAVVKEASIALVDEPAMVPAVADANALIARAIDKNLPVESMERLLAMRRELKAEWSREQYFAALARFQKQCPIIGKSKGVNDKYGKYRYSYAPLDVIVSEVKDVLESNGFSYTLSTEQTPDSVTAICHSHHFAGHSESTKLMVPIEHDAYMNEPQKVASALTYASRYAFRNAFGIMTGDEDDDAQSAGPMPEKMKAQDVTPKAVDPATELEVAHNKLLGLYKQMIALKLFTPEELEEKKKQAADATDAKNLGSLLDLFEAWSQETKERQKK